MRNFHLWENTPLIFSDSFLLIWIKSPSSLRDITDLRFLHFKLFYEGHHKEERIKCKAYSHCLVAGFTEVLENTKLINQNHEQETRYYW